ncbi:AAA family ATPase [Sutterella megalosphaeroides]|nr:AAA family ATPase [Sutterella megalosphaeroides]
MDTRRNPFTPRRGAEPPVLAGRDEALASALTACGRLLQGRSGRPVLLIGDRGMGKTALLRAIAREASMYGFVVSSIDCPKDESERDLAALLAPKIRAAATWLLLSDGFGSAEADEFLSALCRFEATYGVGEGDSFDRFEPDEDPFDVVITGSLEVDLPELFEALGYAFHAAGRGWFIALDDLQLLNAEDLAALLAAVHRVGQLELPVMFVATGLPQILRMTGDAKSYAERLFRFCKLGPLDLEAVRRAIVEPLEAFTVSGTTVTEEALELLARETRGYPFFLQMWASAAWKAWCERTAGGGPEAVREANTLTAADFEATRAEALRTLDRDFYAEALDGATAAEMALLEVMAEKTAESGSETCSAADVATLLGKTEGELSRQVTRMTKKGLIYRRVPGVLAFSAPLAGASILWQKTGR